jgi:hypothetical protein
VNAIDTLRQAQDREIFDYRQLMDSLRAYAKPRDKIGALMAQGVIVRVKKGLYVFGDTRRRQPVCLELLANLIYGPSYVSLEYALSRHGLIPEGVRTVTSVTCGKARRFQTPFGLFTYRPLPMAAYPAGITQEENGTDTYLIATPEKALADFVWADRRFRPGDPAEFEDYLIGDMRMDPDRLKKLNLSSLEEIARGYDNPRIAKLLVFLQKSRRKGR